MKNERTSHSKIKRTSSKNKKFKISISIELSGVRRITRLYFYRAVETKPTGWYSNYCLKTKNIEVLKMNKVLLTAAITGAGDTIQKMKMFQLHHKNSLIQQLNVPEQELQLLIFMLEIQKLEA